MSCESGIVPDSFLCVKLVVLALSSQIIRIIWHSKKIGFCQPIEKCFYTAKMQNLGFFGHFGFTQRSCNHTVWCDRAEVKTAAEPQFFGKLTAAI